MKSPSSLHLPPQNSSRPATKTDLYELRSDTKKDLDKLRSDTKKDLGKLRSDTKKDLDKLRSDTKKDLDKLRSDTKKDLGKLRSDTKKDLDKLRSDTKKDIKEAIKELEARTDLKFDAMLKLIKEEGEETRRYFDVVVENIQNDLTGANADEINLIKDNQQNHEERIVALERQTELI